MTKEEKGVVIEELKEKLSNTTYFYITDASGMSVADTNKFRKLCFEKGIEYKVFKNSLIRKALQSMDVDYTAFVDKDKKVLKGFSGVLFEKEVGNAPAKLLQEFRKQGNEKPVLKGASIDSSFYFGDESLESLTKIKSKLEMIGELVGLLQSPASRLLSALQSGGSKLAGVLKTLSEKEGGEAN
jgi:large subunit ribosomal protein L10